MSASAVTLPPARAVARRRAHALLIANPSASRASEPELAAVARTLRAELAVSVVHTEARGHAAELARDAARAGYDVVAVAGGDGTVSEAAGALAGSPAALACIPAGCTDVFARALGTPRRPHDAAQRLAALAGAGAGALQGRAVDLGTVNGRHFTCTSGVGFSASMTAAVDAAPEAKALIGQLHFARAAVAELGGRYLRRPPRMRVQAAGRSAEGVTVVVQNAHALTYFGTRAVRACDVAALDSGVVSLTLLRRARPSDVAAVLARLLSGRPSVGRHPQVDRFAAVREATVVSADGAPLPLEADGEFLGEHHAIRFGVAPGALRVLA